MNRIVEAIRNLVQTVAAEFIPQDFCDGCYFQSVYYAHAETCRRKQ